MFEPYEIELHLAQLMPVLRLASRNDYHTSRIKHYLSEISSVVYYIKGQDLSVKTEGQREIYQQILTYISKCLDYVLNSTTKGVSSELYYGLRIALEDWISEADKYIFVACDGDLAVWMIENYTNKIYQSIHHECGIDIYYRIIPFYVPRHLRYDYYTNGALYHELGHFVDSIHSVTDTILANICISHTDNLDFRFFNIPTPAPGTSVTVNINELRSHISEYFADVFGAQYVGELIYQNINYVAPKDDFSDTHPKTQLRIQLIKDFLADPVNLNGLLKSINGILHLDIRNKPISVDNFLIGNAVCPSDKHQIHSILLETWKLWRDRREEFVNCNEDQLNYLDIYKRTQKLIERSVQKYRKSTH